MKACTGEPGRAAIPAGRPIMNAGKRGILLCLLTALILSPVWAEGARPQEENLFFSIATGGTGGVWYPLGGAIGGIVGKYVPRTQATSEATTAAIDNLKLLNAGRVGMCFAYDYHVIWSNEGRVPGISGAHNVRMILGFYEQPLHIVTGKRTGITSIWGLKGKRVSVGAPNSGTEEQADYVLRALGINRKKDIKRKRLGATESVAALKDGKIDAFFWSGAIPTTSIADLSSLPAQEMVLLPVGGDTAEKIIKANPGVFHKTVFAKGAYSGVEADIDAIAITAVLQALDTFPEDRLYAILKAIFDNKAEIAAVWEGAADLTPEKAVRQVAPDAIQYLHPGALKFYRENGVLK